jgi:hypothetical protein
MSPLFTAQDGRVVFDGRPVPEYRAIVVRQHLVSLALHRDAPTSQADAAWAIANQLRAALSDAREQRQEAA